MHKKVSFASIFAAILIYIFCEPCFFWWLSKQESVFLILKGVLFLLFLINLDTRNPKLVTLFGLFSLMVLSIPISHGNNIFGFMASMVVCTIPFARKLFAQETYDKFLTIYSVIIGLSTIVWILAILGLMPSLGTIAPLRERKLYSYTLYPLLVMYNNPMEFCRFSGPFDEPGVVGTISAILLTIGKFNLKDKRLVAVLVSGIFSLSFFFYVAMGVYYFVYTIRESKNRKIGYILMAIIAILVVVTYNNEILYETIWQRFEWDDDKGTLKGVNRIGLAATEYFYSIVGTNEFYFGVKDYEYFEMLADGGASIIMAIVQYGILLVSLYIFIFARMGWNNKTTTTTYGLFLFIFIGTIYQRPFIFNPEFLFLFSVMARTCGESIENTTQFT